MYPYPFHDAKDDVPAKPTTEKQRYYLERAARMATKSTMTHQHGCVIVLNGEVVSEGYNRVATHMFHSYSVHSEVDALQKAKYAKHLLADAEMYVVRIAPSKFGHCLKYSRPCTECQMAIAKYGVKRVYYSTNYEYEEAWRIAYEFKRNKR